MKPIDHKCLAPSVLTSRSKREVLSLVLTVVLMVGEAIFPVVGD
jgi:hypothetical protein